MRKTKPLVEPKRASSELQSIQIWKDYRPKSLCRRISWTSISSKNEYVQYSTYSNEILKQQRGCTDNDEIRGCLHSQREWERPDEVTLVVKVERERFELVWLSKEPMAKRCGVPFGLTRIELRVLICCWYFSSRCQLTSCLDWSLLVWAPTKLQLKCVWLPCRCNLRVGNLLLISNAL